MSLPNGNLGFCHRSWRVAEGLISKNSILSDWHNSVTLRVDRSEFLPVLPGSGRMTPRILHCCLFTVLSLALSGCVTMDAGGPPVANPVFVRANNSEEAWERTVDVVHDYLFEIERENKLGGVIETRYKTGASLMEPWHPDSVGQANRLQSTLQSIRRKAYVRFTPAPGGYLVAVEAIKELEDVPRAANFAGGATFLDNSALQRDLNPVVGQATPSGWIDQGRDPALEQAMLRTINRRFSQ
jgi:hypothetical protein